MRLYIEGHNHRKGYGISKEFSYSECSSPNPPIGIDAIEPVIFIKERDKAFRFVQRYNRMFATH